MRGDRRKKKKEKKEDETEEANEPVEEEILARCRPRNQWPIPPSVFSVPTSNNCVLRSRIRDKFATLHSFKPARQPDTSISSLIATNLTEIVLSYLPLPLVFRGNFSLEFLSNVLPDLEPGYIGVLGFLGIALTSHEIVGWWRPRL